MDSPSADDPKSLHGRIIRGSTENYSPHRRYNTRFENKNDEGFPRISIICYAYNTKNTRTNQSKRSTSNTSAYGTVPQTRSRWFVQYSYWYETENQQYIPYGHGNSSCTIIRSNSVIRFDRAACRTFLMRLPADPLVPASA